MREAACQGPGVVRRNQGTVAKGRCVSPYASVANEASVGESACREEAACAFAKGSIGKDNHLQGGNGAQRRRVPAGGLTEGVASGGCC